MRPPDDKKYNIGDDCLPANLQNSSSLIPIPYVVGKNVGHEVAEVNQATERS